MFMKTDSHSVKSDQKYQYAYCRSPLYCNMDEATLDISGWNFWDDMDGSLDAPECLPVGSRRSRDLYSSSAIGNFVCREWEEAERLHALTEKLFAEMKAEGLL